MLYPGSRFRMAADLQETYLRQLLAAHRDAPEVTVAWQGGEPTLMGMGPVPATERVLRKAGLSLQDVDLVEVNEAFACVPMFAMRDIGIPHDKVNVNGGGTALGHPIGASGARILVTLLHEMVKRDAKKGIASLCIGGGMGVALTVER